MDNNKLIQVAAGCGLHCGACSLYIGSTEAPERLRILSERMGQTHLLWL
ncbi:MAG TPA: hypothetical protein PK252_04000 [Bacteroidales bacterium]|nr:hypothetical protein [Bacteroidales bacterium]